MFGVMKWDDMLLMEVMRLEEDGVGYGLVLDFI